VDIWQREEALARTKVAWGMASVVAGLGLVAATGTPWRRSFGLQTAGWGAVDLGIAAVGLRLQGRRMSLLPDPYAAQPQEAERRKLWRILMVNAVADVGYVALGMKMARDSRSRVSGAGVAVVVQGAFLLLHDSFHAVGCANDRHVTSQGSGKQEP
jgi:hypothetical protein